MRFIIRADASREIGAGHVMRVSAIAEELIDRGLEVIFVGDIDMLPWVQERIISLGFAAVYSSTSSFTSRPETDVLILDSYVIDPLDEFIGPKEWRKVVAIVDDTTPAYRANLYVHSGSGTNWTPPPDCADATFLAGIDYLAVRKSIRDIVGMPRTDSSKSLRIAVVGGGSDPYGFCSAVSKFLHNLDGDFLASVFTDNREEFPIDPRFLYLPIGPEFEKTLPNVDLVFTTAGTSSWELLSLGLPIGLALAADNQLVNYEHQTQQDLALSIGYYEFTIAWHLDPENIESLVNNPKVRAALQDNARDAIDGRGVERIVDSITMICGD